MESYAFVSTLRLCQPLFNQVCTGAIIRIFLFPAPTPFVPHRSGTPSWAISHLLHSFRVPKLHWDPLWLTPGSGICLEPDPSFSGWPDSSLFCTGLLYTWCISQIAACFPPILSSAPLGIPSYLGFHWEGEEHWLDQCKETMGHGLALK